MPDVEANAILILSIDTVIRVIMKIMMHSIEILTDKWCDFQLIFQNVIKTVRKPNRNNRKTTQHIFHTVQRLLATRFKNKPIMHCTCVPARQLIHINSNLRIGSLTIGTLSKQTKTVKMMPKVLNPLQYLGQRSWRMVNKSALKSQALWLNLNTSSGSIMATSYQIVRLLEIKFYLPRGSASDSKMQ